MSLVSKDESPRTSMVHVGYWILKELNSTKDGRISLIDLGGKLRKQGITRARPMNFGLVFLHLAGLIEFRAPYIYKVKP